MKSNLARGVFAEMLGIYRGNPNVVMNRWGQDLRTGNKELARYIQGQTRIRLPDGGEHKISLHYNRAMIATYQLFRLAAAKYECRLPVFPTTYLFRWEIPCILSREDQNRRERLHEICTEIQNRMWKDGDLLQLRNFLFAQAYRTNHPSWDSSSLLDSALAEAHTDVHVASALQAMMCMYNLLYQVGSLLPAETGWDLPAKLTKEAR